jgi:hypothetical protein
MSLDIFIRQKLSCPRHPRYNPEREGEAGIKGGCMICSELLQLWRQTTAFQEELHGLASRMVAERKRERA